MAQSKVFFWQGSGWYGKRSVGGAAHYYSCGGTKGDKPDGFAYGLYDLQWYDSPPKWATEIKGAPGL